MVHRHNVSANLPDVSRFKFTRFHLDYDICMDLRVIEKKINKLFFIADLDPIFAAHIGEAGPKLDEKALDIINKSILELAFVISFFYCQEIEVIGISCDLFRKVATDFRKVLSEIVDGLALTCIKIGLNEAEQHGTRPVICNSLIHIEQSLLSIFSDMVENEADMTPRN